MERLTGRDGLVRDAVVKFNHTHAKRGKLTMSRRPLCSQRTGNNLGRAEVLIPLEQLEFLTQFTRRCQCVGYIFRQFRNTANEITERTYRSCNSTCELERNTFELHNPREGRTIYAQPRGLGLGGGLVSTHCKS